MAALLFNLEGQLLTQENQEIIASGDANTDTCTFMLDDIWTGYVITAVFWQDKRRVSYAVLDRNNQCYIPAAAMQAPKPLKVGIFGINGNRTLTSTIVQIDIREGAVSGDVDLEPTDNIFLALIAQYQTIVSQMDQHNTSAAEIKVSFAELFETVNKALQDQDAELKALGAFEVDRILERLDTVQATTNGFQAQVQDVLERFTALYAVPINLIDGICRIESELITANSLCDVYFDEYSYELACNAPMLVSSFDGYMNISTSVQIDATLTANIVIRRF